MKDKKLLKKMLIIQIFSSILTVMVAVIALFFTVTTSMFEILDDLEGQQFVAPPILIVIANITLMVLSWRAYHRLDSKRAHLYTKLPFFLSVPYLCYILYQILSLIIEFLSRNAS